MSCRTDALDVVARIRERYLVLCGTADVIFREMDKDVFCNRKLDVFWTASIEAFEKSHPENSPDAFIGDIVDVLICRRFNIPKDRAPTARKWRKTAKSLRKSVELLCSNAPAFAHTDILVHWPPQTGRGSRSRPAEFGMTPAAMLLRLADELERGPRSLFDKYFKDFSVAKNGPGQRQHRVFVEKNLDRIFNTHLGPSYPPLLISKATQVLFPLKSFDPVDIVNRRRVDRSRRSAHARQAR
jgi:hypothetical protein